MTWPLGSPPDLRLRAPNPEPGPEVEDPVEGWVRGLRAENARLRGEVTRLRALLAKSAPATPEIDGPGD
jgi:hypothetical protein